MASTSWWPQRPDGLNVLTSWWPRRPDGPNVLMAPTSRLVSGPGEGRSTLHQSMLSVRCWIEIRTCADMAEELELSKWRPEMRVLPACTECGILPGASGVISKVVWHDRASIWLVHDKPYGVALVWICGSTRDLFISYTPAKVTLQLSNLEVWICCNTRDLFISCTPAKVALQ